MSAVSDEALVERIARGDQAALQALYARHSVKIFRFVVRLLRDEGRAEDIVSEVFIDVWKSAAHFEARSAVGTWLLTIARNKAISQMRRTRDQELDEDYAGGIADESDDPEVVLQKQGKSGQLRACIAQLSPEHREVIDLVYYHDKSVEEVAAIVGIPEGTVKTRMFHARKRLSELAAKTGMDRGWP